MKKLFKRPTFYMFVILMGIMVISCSKSPTYTLETTDMDMVYSEYTEGTDFTTFKTFFISDSLILDDDDMSDEDRVRFQNTYQTVRQETIKNMVERNYTQVPDEASSDLAFSVMIVTRTNHVYGYGGWWGWPWYPGWSGGWYGYPGGGYYYPWAVYMGSFEDGAVITDMLDMSTADTTTQKIDIVWSSLIGGILSSSSTANTQRLTGYVDQAFIQSPYLKTN